MPCGLRNAPATFQRTLNIILSGVLWKTHLVNINEILVVLMENQKHLKDIDEAVTLLRRAGVTLNLPNFFFSKTKTEYLGHILMSGKLGSVLRAWMQSRLLSS